MKTKKLLTLSLLAFCSMAGATEYKSPEVGFKKHVAPSKLMKTADFGDHYKVDNNLTDRQIASEDDPASDREPSSVPPKSNIKEMRPEGPEAVVAPQPWLYRNQLEGPVNGK